MNSSTLDEIVIVVNQPPRALGIMQHARLHAFGRLPVPGRWGPPTSREANAESIRCGDGDALWLLTL